MGSIFEVIPGNRRNRVKLTIPDLETVDEDGRPSAILLLEMDATLQESHSMRSEVSDSPVEDGSVISDHVNLLPKELVLNCVISNNPLSFRDAVIGNAAGLVGGILGRATLNNYAAAISTGALATIAKKISRTVVNDNARVLNAIQKLQAAWESAALISVEGALTTYNNMLITDISMSRSAATGDTLPFTITLREVRIVRSLVVRVPKEVVDVISQPSAVSEQDNGKQPVNEPTEEQEATLFQRLRRIDSPLKIGWDFLRR